MPLSGFWKAKKLEAAGRTTFGTGIAVPFVVLPPASRSWASAALVMVAATMGLWQLRLWGLGCLEHPTRCLGL